MRKSRGWYRLSVMIKKTLVSLRTTTHWKADSATLATIRWVWETKARVPTLGLCWVLTQSSYPRMVTTRAIGPSTSQTSTALRFDAIGSTVRTSTDHWLTSYIRSVLLSHLVISRTFSLEISFTCPINRQSIMSQLTIRIADQSGNEIN